MGKTTKTSSTVSWRTLTRRAATASPKVAAKLRKQASELRRKERAKKTKTTKKTRRPAKTATPARRKPGKNTLKGLAHLTVDQANAAIDQAMNDTATTNDPALMFSPAEHHKAIFDAIQGAVHRANDGIVCSFIAMYRTNGNPGHMPWTVEAETIRALIEVLDRNGYTASGRGESEVRKAS